MGTPTKPSRNLTAKGGIAIKNAGRAQGVDYSKRIYSYVVKDIGEDRSIADAGRLMFPGAGKCDDIAGWRV